MYRGSIPVGSIVNTVFEADFSNAGTALLVVTYGPDEGDPTVKVDLAAPGGAARTSVEVAAPGFLRIWVDVSEEEDSGRLKVDGDLGAIQGDMTWVYTVE